MWAKICTLKGLIYVEKNCVFQCISILSTCLHVHVSVTRGMLHTGHSSLVDSTVLIWLDSAVWKCSNGNRSTSIPGMLWQVPRVNGRDRFSHRLNTVIPCRCKASASLGKVPPPWQVLTLSDVQLVTDCLRKKRCT